MKKTLAVVLFFVLVLTACGQKDITEGVYIEEVEIKEGLMLAGLLEAGWKFDIESHVDADFLNTPVAGGEEIEIKMLLAGDGSSVILYCENKTEGRIVLNDCPISRFEVYSGDVGHNLTLPGGTTFSDSKNEIVSKLGKPATESDYAIRYDNVPGIADLTFVFKDDQKTLERIDIFL